MLREIIKQIEIYIKRPLSFFDNWAEKGRLNWMPDKMFLTLMFRSKMGYWMDWKNPCTFNEKLQWLKLYDRPPLYTQLVDKYEVRKYVAEKIGADYLIPQLGVWNKVDDIDFDALPNKFVIKCTHDSGSAIICKDKAKLNLKEIRTKISHQLSRNFYFVAREWPYKTVLPQIIIEKYLENENGSDIKDYKFFCFNGQPKIMYISNDKSATPTTDFFDMDFNHIALQMKDPNSSFVPTKPLAFDHMKYLAAQLSKNIPHVRVDFYNIAGKIYFGELTFYHNAGFFPIFPKQMAYTLGNWISLENYGSHPKKA